MLKFFGVDQLIFFSIYAENASLYSYADQNDRSMLGAVSEVVRNSWFTYHWFPFDFQVRNSNSNFLNKNF